MVCCPDKPELIEAGYVNLIIVGRDLKPVGQKLGDKNRADFKRSRDFSGKFKFPVLNSGRPTRSIVIKVVSAGLGRSNPV